MADSFWHRQTVDAPLFPDLLWSRPQNQRTAGKLLIIGGNIHGFSAPAQAYAEAERAGVGTVRVVLPDALQKTVHRLFVGAEFAPSSPSGSFAKAAMATLLSESQWADAVLLAGDLGRNSETAMALESFVGKYSGPLIMTKDAADYFTAAPTLLLQRNATTMVISLAQLQKLAQEAHFPRAFTFGMDSLQLVDVLHEFTKFSKLAVIVKHLELVFVAVGGEVSTTKLHDEQDIWRVPTAACAAVWWLQNLDVPFAALSTAMIANYVES